MSLDVIALGKANRAQRTATAAEEGLRGATPRVIARALEHDTFAAVYFGTTSTYAELILPTSLKVRHLIALNTLSIPVAIAPGTLDRVTPQPTTGWVSVAPGDEHLMRGSLPYWAYVPITAGQTAGTEAGVLRLIGRKSA